MPWATRTRSSPSFSPRSTCRSTASSSCAEPCRNQLLRTLHSASVIASHNVPDSIDLVSLSAHALEMLRAMRESSAKMGIGAVPAVTIHSEKGPITFFHQEDLCLLVLHKDVDSSPGCVRSSNRS